MKNIEAISEFFTINQNNGTFSEKSVEQNIVLLERVLCGDNEAKKQFVNCNMGWVNSLAKRYAWNCEMKHVEELDLLNAAVYGLCLGLEHLERLENATDSLHAYKAYLNYLTTWINREVRNEVRNASLLSVGEHDSRSKDEVKREYDEALKSNAVYGISLQTETENEDGAKCELGDTLEDDGMTPSEEAEQNDMMEQLIRAVNKLDARAQKIVKMHFGICGMEKSTQPQIAVQMGLSTMRINQIEREALAELKEMLEK